MFPQNYHLVVRCLARQVMGDRLRWPVGFMGKTLKTFASRLARTGAVGKRGLEAVGALTQCRSQ